MYQHHGNGEHPQSLERRRQVLLWRSLAALIVFGVAVGLLRLLIGLLGDTPSRSLLYQAGLLTVNGLLGLLVAARLRWLRRR